eukprot:TRINITY_DN38728_c0_g1_i1.p1 TRINITY_DN38728_c0_g1~~TRINITY_DN38728_c0_g1_i1.p1  ORF type:complete len:1271 (-),score=240.67 TRINITY_DN38728_c0_g1_i1:89-3814(-)
MDHQPWAGGAAYVATAIAVAAGAAARLQLRRRSANCDKLAENEGTGDVASSADEASPLAAKAREAALASSTHRPATMPQQAVEQQGQAEKLPIQEGCRDASRMTESPSPVRGEDPCRAVANSSGSTSQASSPVHQEGCYEVRLERTGGEAWGFAWQVGAHAELRLIVAGVSPASPPGRWSSERRASGLRAIERGDELVGVNLACDHGSMRQELASASAAVMRFLPAGAVTPLGGISSPGRAGGVAAAAGGGVRSALARRRLAASQAAAAGGSSPGLSPPSPLSPGPVPPGITMSGSKTGSPQNQPHPVGCLVKNTFIEVQDDELCKDSRIIRSDPSPIQGLAARLFEPCSSVQEALAGGVQSAGATPTGNRGGILSAAICGDAAGSLDSSGTWQTARSLSISGHSGRALEEQQLLQRQQQLQAAAPHQQPSISAEVVEEANAGSQPGPAPSIQTLPQEKANAAASPFPAGAAAVAAAVTPGLQEATAPATTRRLDDALAAKGPQSALAPTAAAAHTTSPQADSDADSVGSGDSGGDQAQSGARTRKPTRRGGRRARHRKEAAKARMVAQQQAEGGLDGGLEAPADAAATVQPAAAAPPLQPQVAAGFAAQDAVRRGGRPPKKSVLAASAAAGAFGDGSHLGGAGDVRSASKSSGDQGGMSGMSRSPDTGGLGLHQDGNSVARGVSPQQLQRRTPERPAVLTIESPQQVAPAATLAGIQMPGSPPADLEVIGKRVLITGLVRAPHFNNQWGRVEAYDASMQRYIVQVILDPASGQAPGQPVMAKLKRENMIVPPPLSLNLADSVVDPNSPLSLAATVPGPPVPQAHMPGMPVPPAYQPPIAPPVLMPGVGSPPAVGPTLGTAPPLARPMPPALGGPPVWQGVSATEPAFLPTYPQPPPPNMLQSKDLRGNGLSHHGLPQSPSVMDPSHAIGNLGFRGRGPSPLSLNDLVAGGGPSADFEDSMGLRTPATAAAASNLRLQGPSADFEDSRGLKTPGTAMGAAAGLRLHGLGPSADFEDSIGALLRTPVGASSSLAYPPCFPASSSRTGAGEGGPGECDSMGPTDPAAHSAEDTTRAVVAAALAGGPLPPPSLEPGPSADFEDSVGGALLGFLSRVPPHIALGSAADFEDSMCFLPPSTSATPLAKSNLSGRLGYSLSTPTAGAARGMPPRESPPPEPGRVPALDADEAADATSAAVHSSQTGGAASRPDHGGLLPAAGHVSSGTPPSLTSDSSSAWRPSLRLT